MKRKILGILVCTLLITTIIPATASFAGDNSDIELNLTNDEIYNEIENRDCRILSIDEIIGNVRVKYWEHVIDGVKVKNDYILLHLDPNSNNILHYEYDWSNVGIPVEEPVKNVFEPKEYFWMDTVIFNDEEDCTYFYTFNEVQEYPVLCHEVRHEDGTTILYSLDGNSIGQGIPAPSEGFSLSGYHNATWPDPWLPHRQNASYWFSKWCSSETSLSNPTPATISTYVKDSDVELFYELAHGGSWSFQANAAGSYYYSSGSGYNVQSDMANRQPITFAFIGSCEGMDSTGPGTFSYEFRKGTMVNTVTVGYDGMGSCPGWGLAIPWQDYMFQKMNANYTIKQAFDMADAQYPTIAPCTVFVGDINTKAKSHHAAKDVNTVETINNVYQSLYLSKLGNKPFIFNIPILNWLLERFPNAFPILRILLEL